MTTSPLLITGGTGTLGSLVLSRLRAGENLTLEGVAVGKRTWEDFLAERLRSGV